MFFLLSAAMLYAEEPQDNFESKSIWDYHPIHVGSNVLFFSPAAVDVRKDSHQGHLLFNKQNVYFYAIIPASKSTFFFPRVEWNRFTLDWNKNPKFHQTHFEYIQFALTCFSLAIEQWRWIGRVEYNVAVNQFAKAHKYSLFSALLWGAHELNEKWHCHLGAVGYTGFEGQMIYPIVGLDYAPTKKWLIQVIFPINYSVEYAITDRWRLSIKGRPLKERFRTGKNNPQPRSVFSYSSMGAELNLHYEKFLHIEAEVFAGYSFGGNFYIKDRTGHNALYTNLQQASYAGASLNWGF